MINKYSNIPLYSQLKELIIEKIESGEYPPDSRIPSEQELCDSFDISRPTVRQAINELTSSGALYRMKGKGTFVSKAKTLIDIKNYSGFTDSILDSEVPGVRDILQISEIPGRKNKALCDIFNVTPAPSQEIQFAEFLYVTKEGNEVISLNTSYIPLYLFSNIIEDVKNKKPSYDILKGKYPLLPSKSKSTLDIVFADQNDAQQLQIQMGQPVVRIENVLFSKSGQVIEYVVTKYRADKCRLVFENSR
ncbi:MAG: GntR family transcriptional regulator [Eubacteriales bacterium]|nr:GntR family transcriptional regulator [Eubacteriales bacterium]